MCDFAEVYASRQRGTGTHASGVLDLSLKRNVSSVLASPRRARRRHAYLTTELLVLQKNLSILVLKKHQQHFFQLSISSQKIFDRL